MSRSRACGRPASEAATYSPANGQSASCRRVEVRRRDAGDADEEGRHVAARPRGDPEIRDEILPLLSMRVAVVARLGDGRRGEGQPQPALAPGAGEGATLRMRPTLVLPDRTSWLEARRQGLGGSDAAAVLGVSPYQTPLQLFADKLGLVDPGVESEEMRWGRLLEPLIATRYAEETERTLAPAEPYTIAVHPECDFIRATLDRVILQAGDKPVPAPLEMKTANAFRADEWEEEPPVHVQVQGQHQLLVTGSGWVSFAVLIGGNRFRWVDMERNDTFIALLAERLKAFWRRVQLNDPPPVTADDKDVLAALYPREQADKRIALPPAADTWDADREVAMKELAK